jgi:hypothetical protein
VIEPSAKFALISLYLHGTIIAEIKWFTGSVIILMGINAPAVSALVHIINTKRELACLTNVLLMAACEGNICLRDSMFPETRLKLTD